MQDPLSERTLINVNFAYIGVTWDIAGDVLKDAVAAGYFTCEIPAPSPMEIIVGMNYFPWSLGRIFVITEEGRNRRKELLGK